MTRRQILTALAHGLLVTSAVAPAVAAATPADEICASIYEIDSAEPDTLLINGRAFLLE